MGAWEGWAKDDSGSEIGCHVMVVVGWCILYGYVCSWTPAGMTLGHLPNGITSHLASVCCSWPICAHLPCSRPSVTLWTSMPYHLCTSIRSHVFGSLSGSGRADHAGHSANHFTGCRGDHGYDLPWDQAFPPARQQQLLDTFRDLPNVVFVPWTLSVQDAPALFGAQTPHLVHALYTNKGVVDWWVLLRTSKRPLGPAVAEYPPQQLTSMICLHEAKLHCG